MKEFSAFYETRQRAWIMAGIWGGRPRNRAISSKACYPYFLQNAVPTLRFTYTQPLIYSVRRKYPLGLYGARSSPPSRVEPKKDEAINLLRHIPSWRALAHFHLSFPLQFRNFLILFTAAGYSSFSEPPNSVKSSKPHFCTVYFRSLSRLHRPSISFFLRRFRRNVMYLFSHTWRCASSPVHLIIFLFDQLVTSDNK
jgi:hypothetical protein